MSNKFDWKTEEDFDWDNFQEDPPSKKFPDNRKRWLTILGIALILSALGAFLYYQVDQRIENNTAAMRSDVISSYNLLRLAELEQDDELFFSLLSGRNDSWTTAQHKLFQLQSLRDRQPFGLKVLPLDTTEPDEKNTPTITFSPDLLVADVATLLPYEINIGNGLTETLTLQENVQYRLGRERWLLAPPDQEFWGPEESLDGSRIKLTYAQRDKELAERLLPDLDRKLDEMCSTLVDFECENNLLLHLILSTDPQTLVNISRPNAAVPTGQGLEINLPTPTIVGIPQDEVGYQALFRGYAALMATALLSQQSGYECCQKLPFQQALIDYQLSQIALKPWPVSDADYGLVLKEQIHLNDYRPFWGSEDPQDLYGPDGWRIYVLVDYLLNTLPHNNPVILQRELVQSSTFAGWLNGLFETEREHKGPGLMSVLTRGFWMRGYVQNLNHPEATAIDPPAQDLYLACSTIPLGDRASQVSTLYQFDFNESEWANIYETPGELWTASLPGDNILLQQEYIAGIQHWMSTLRQKDQPPMPLSAGDNLTVSFAQADPKATGLTAYVFGSDSDEAIITWFDLQDCSETGGCSGRELPGIPVWSPNGENALFTDNPGNQFDLLPRQLLSVMLNQGNLRFADALYLGERSQFLEGESLTKADELPSVGSGHSPFWIDNETIGYVTGESDPINHPSSQIMATAVNQNDPRVLFTLRDIPEEILESFDPMHIYWIHYVMVHPENPDQLFIAVFYSQNMSVHVLSYNLDTNEAKFLMSAGFHDNHSLGISPDGRYLVLTGVDEDDPDPTVLNTLMLVYDLELEKIIPFQALTSDFPPFLPYDWSGDGQWLAIMLDQDTVGLFAPENMQMQLLKTPSADCGTPTWINR
jgi:hypothetical protein